MRSTKLLCAMIALVIIVSGCAGASHPAPATVVTEEAPASAAAETPAPATRQSSEGYSVNELDGIAGEYDPLPMHQTYEESRSANDEVIGWLTIDGTIINYPVLRTDNNDYYLTHDVDRNDSKYGAIYMDFRNADSRMQKHIIIYGHNMKNGTMFHDLVNYKQRDFFNQNSRIYFLWDGVDTEWEVFCAYIVEPDTIYPIRTYFDDDDHFAQIMNDTVKYANTVTPSNTQPDILIQRGDQVLSLVTCTYEYDDSRFVVMARRVK